MKRDTSDSVRTRAVGIVVPVHDEERRLGDAVRALETAILALEDHDLAVRVVIVLDACRDTSVDVAEWWRSCTGRGTRFLVTVVHCEVRNVGRARAIGCNVLLEEFSDLDVDAVWLATTDADSQVPPEWLQRQVAQHERGADVWAGRVAVADWPTHRRHIASLWQSMYDAERYPIHGASLGFNAGWYVAVGGFSSRRTGEDRALYEELRAKGATVHHDSVVRVITSARRRARAPEGFAAALTRIEAWTTAGAG